MYLFEEDNISCSSYFCGIDLCFNYLFDCMSNNPFNNSRRIENTYNYEAHSNLGYMKKNDDIIIEIDELVDRSNHENLNVIENYMDLV